MSFAVYEYKTSSSRFCRPGLLLIGIFDTDTQAVGATFDGHMRPLKRYVINLISGEVIK